MAKTTQCQFCGKELTTGFFNGNATSVDVAPGVSITCCEACREEKKDVAKINKERFGIKLANYKQAAKKKPSEAEIAAMYSRYEQEQVQHTVKSACDVPTRFTGFFWHNENGAFGVKEFQQGFMSSDVSAKSMVKSLKKANRVDFYGFTKDDVTKLEFRQVGMGDPLGLFAIAYSFEIRLNDEKVVTYKPCITRTAVLGRGFLGFFCKKSARKQMHKMLETFKQVTGCTMPIVEVKKFN